MHNAYSLFSLTSFVLILLLFIGTAYSQQYVIVEMENGDRLTGTWRGATDTHFEIKYNEQILRFPLEGHTLSFISKLENVPDRIAAKHFRNGRDLLDLNFPELAERQFEKALEEFPKFADAHYQLGLLYKIDGDFPRALERFRSVALIDAEKFDLVPQLQEIGNNAIAMIDDNGDATVDDNVIAMEKYAQAVDAFQLILKHYPEHESVPTLTYRVGFLLIKQLKDTMAGLELLQTAVKEFPNIPEHEEAVYQIGVLQAETGEPEKALNTLKQFSRIYPESNWVDDAHLKRAIIYLQVGDRENAVNLANLVLQNTDDSNIFEQADDVLQASAWDIYTDKLPDPNIQTIAVDGTSLWIGTPKGIAQIETDRNGGWVAIEGSAWLINEGVPTVPDVHAIVVNEAEIWVGTRNQGVIHLNRGKDEVTNYSIANGLPSMWIRDIKMDNEEIWFATDVGVMRQNLKAGIQNHYNKENSDIPNNDIHSIALTPDTVWIGTSGDNIAIFDRKTEDWSYQRFTKIEPETQIVKFDVVENKTLFSWYNENEENQGNGFFKANWDGTDGDSFPVRSDLEEKEELDDIYVAGIAGKKYLWVAVNNYVAIYYLDIGEYDKITIEYPKIVLDDLSIQCIAINNDRAWIGTNKGMLMIDKQKFDQTTE